MSLTSCILGVLVLCPQKQRITVNILKLFSAASSEPFHPDRSRHITSLRHLFWCCAVTVGGNGGGSACMCCLSRKRDKRTHTDHRESNCLIFQRRKGTQQRRRNWPKVAKLAEVNTLSPPEIMNKPQKGNASVHPHLIAECKSSLTLWAQTEVAVI